MSQDPAFLYYDGDAAKDVSHMNRLERGCYFDLIQAQRKFGRMSIDIIKKVLGKDFESCWDSLKLILTYVDHMYFIFWVERESLRRKKYIDGRKNNRNAQNTTKNANSEQKNETTYVEHMDTDTNTSSFNTLKQEIQIPEHLKEIWPDYLAMRTKIKKPATIRAQNNVIKELEKLSNGDQDIQVKIIEQSITNSWQGVFPLKIQQVQTQEKKKSIYSGVPGR